MTERVSEVTEGGLVENWAGLSFEERRTGFNALPRTAAEVFFLDLSAEHQVELLQELSPSEKRSWLRLLEPDDAADLIQALPPEAKEDILQLLDSTLRREVTALLAYAEDDAGGLMNPHYVRLRPDLAVDEAIAYLRAQARGQTETIYYAYVVANDQKLLGVVSFRELLSAQPTKRVRDILKSDIVTLPEDMDQEEVAMRFAQHDLLALPVVDKQGCMKGIVTVDDVVGVVQEEATEDIQKIGGTEVLSEPYLDVGFLKMMKKRVGWLTTLFIGEMLTASAMLHFEHEIARAVVLALFIPLIISSGGNSGSQATTLIIRAMALGEVRLRDWWRVFFRELSTGLGLGLVLGLIGLIRVYFWRSVGADLGEHVWWVGLTVAFSLVGVVLWGSLVGAMLPFGLRRLGLDPATSSAPFVATLVDVTGLVIYFSFASLFLAGRLL